MQKTKVDYSVKYTFSDYTFPVEARIERVEFDDTNIIIHLEDGRFLGVPLAWIPTLANASPAERKTYFLNEERTTIHWDPEDGVNENLRLSTYLRGNELPSASSTPEK